MRFTDPFERSQIARYLLNLLNSSHCTTQFMKQLCAEGRVLVMALRLYEIDESLVARMEDGAADEMGRAELKTFLLRLQDDLTSALTKLCEASDGRTPGELECVLSDLTGQLDFGELDRVFFGLLLRHHLYGPFSRLLNHLTQETLELHDACAACLGVETSDLRESLRPTATLLASGAVKAVDRSGKDLDDHYEILDCVRNALTKGCRTAGESIGAILGATVPATLKWQDFEHLGATRERLERFVEQALSARLAGVNILLWGPPGTGKTEFGKVIAARLGVRFYCIGEKDEEGNEPNRRERLDSYRLAQNLLRGQSRTLLIFDEMDDAFGSSSLARLLGERNNNTSKVFMNRLLEQNPVPTLWIVNEVERLDPAFLRRMTLVVAFKVPPASSRERVWKRVLDRNGVTLPEPDIGNLAALNLAPAIVDSAARFTRQIGGNAEDFRFAAGGIVQAMHGGRPLPPQGEDEAFLPELTCADLDLETLTQQLDTSGSRRFSLCLYGPPGTGKSAYLRHLARQLGMPVLLKRASDLLDMYVGNSEKRIAAAFAEALEQEAFLIFDEADSLLSDRRLAQRSWEVSQVNEMLTWMERHPLPFACTTNLKERLDPASLRRFTIKAHLDYMSPDQVVVAFQHFFEQSIELPTARAIGRITPGDFSLVERKARHFGQRDNPERLIEMLCQEVDCRNDNPMKAIGFAPLEKTTMMDIDRTASAREVK